MKPGSPFTGGIAPSVAECCRSSSLSLVDVFFCVMTHFRASYRHSNLSWVAQPGNAELYVRGLESYSALDPAESVRFRALLEEYFFAYRATYERMKLGYDSPAWTMQVRTAASVIKTTVGAEWWIDRTIFGQDLVQEMDKHAQKEDAT